MKASKFSEFMRGPVPAPQGVRPQYQVAIASKPPTHKQVDQWLAPPEACPQEMGLAEVCDCRDHRGDPIHGFREFGAPMPRIIGEGANIFPPGSTDPLMLQDSEAMTARINGAIEAAAAAVQQAELAEQAQLALAAQSPANAEALAALTEEVGHAAALLAYDLKAQGEPTA
jgi:hypothetical protein